MIDLASSAGELVAWIVGGGATFTIAAQQIWRRFKVTNGNIKVDTEVSAGTVEVIKLLREQAASAAESNAKLTAQYEQLINSNSLRYKELLDTNNSLYTTINNLQKDINSLNSKIGDYQIANKHLQDEIDELRVDNTKLTSKVDVLTTEINKFKKGLL